MSSVVSQKRRQVLSGLMKLLGLIGLIFLSIPFISSFTSDDINEKQNATSHWVITHAVSDFVVGEVKALSWAGGLVWIYARTKNDIAQLKNSNTSLSDALSEKSDQPENLKNNFRSENKKYFVFIPQENKNNCQVRLDDDKDKVIFTDPCFNAKYDAAGRIFKNSGHKEQKNLAVPKHVVEEGVLKIGIWTPKI